MNRSRLRRLTLPELPDCPDSGKRSFNSQADAMRLIQHLHRTSKRLTIPLRAYLCPACHFWHMTSRENAGKPRRHLPVPPAEARPPEEQA